MENDRIEDLESRIATLEASLQQLTRRLDQKPEKSNVSNVSEKSRRVEPINQVREESRVEYLEQASQLAKPQQPFWEKIQLGENWLNKIGIALLLLGLAFLFNYAIDKGWITPSIRVVLGLLMGGGLLALGTKLHDERRALASVLLGGGVAALYISIYAAFQMYDLLPHMLAFAFMVCITLLAFILAIRLNEWTTSLIAVVGGLATPFILYNGDGSLFILLSYLLLVIGLASAVYYVKAWPSLMSIASYGGFIALGISLIDSPSTQDRWLIAGTVALAGLVLWLTPVLREKKHGQLPVTVSSGVWARLVDRFRRNHVHVSTYLIPLVVLPLIAAALPHTFWSKVDWGFLSIGTGLLFAFVGFSLRSSLKKLGNNHIISACVLICIGVFSIFDGHSYVMVLSLAVFSIALMYLSERLEDKHLVLASLLFGIILSVWLLSRFADYADQPALINMAAICDLLSIASLLVISFRIKFDHRIIFRGIAHIAILAWLARELVSLDGGQAYVSIAWGLYAFGLIVWGFVKNHEHVRLAGMLTLFLVVAKLFFIDLSELEAIWRIILFLGFGAVLLLLSFYLPKMKGKQAEDEASEPN